MIYWTIAILLGLIILVCGYLFYKKYRNHKKYCQFLRESLHKPLLKKENDYSALFPASLVVGEYLWQIYTIDPSLIKAIDFSSTQNLDSAYAVSNYLIAGGIDPMRLSSEGFGESKPIDTNKTNAGKANNRRVEVKLVK